MVNKLRKVIRLSNKERTLFLQAYLIICYTSVMITIIPIRSFLKRIGEQGKESTSTIANETLLEVSLIEKAVRRAIKYLPWRTKCFSRAVTAKVLLKKKGISSTLYLGVAKEGNSNMIAHAWLRCGNIIVTGKEEMNRFTPVIYYT